MKGIKTMVTTPEKSYRTPPSSRGTSPSRVVNNKRNTPNASPNKKACPVKGILKKGESTDRKRKPTPERIVNGARRGSSPSRTQNQLVTSRGSE